MLAAEIAMKQIANLYCNLNGIPVFYCDLTLSYTRIFIVMLKIIDPSLVKYVSIFLSNLYPRQLILILNQEHGIQ